MSREDPSCRPYWWVGPSHLGFTARALVQLTSQAAATPQPPALPPLAPGALTRASRLHPRTAHWCSASVGASQVSGRQSGRPSSPPSRRAWCQGCALPGRLPSSPARHPVEPVPGVRGQAFWGESVCPMLPWRQLFPRPMVESPEGGSWARAGDGESMRCIYLPATTVPYWGQPRGPGPIHAGAH